MSDESEKPKKPSLSEISHLFLSSVRDRQTEGTSRPKRVPPKRSDMTIDLTPEEFAKAYGPGGAAPAAEPLRKVVPVAAIIGAHLNGKQFDWVKQYARHRAGSLGRIGLIELDASEFRLMCFDPGAAPSAAEADAVAECAEPRQMMESLEEMNWDVEQWLLLLPNPRTPEAKALLRETNHWILLSTSDHDGVVSSYRMLKGLADSYRPRLTLSVLDATDDAESGRVYQKLSGVCAQFLNWPLEAEPPVEAARFVNEHLALLYRTARDKAQLATGSQWTVVSEFLAAQKAAEASAAARAEVASDPTSDLADIVDANEARHLVADMIVPAEPVAAVQFTAPLSTPPIEDIAPSIPLPQPVKSSPVLPAISAPIAANTIDDVIDLPGHDDSGQSILDAVLRKSAGTLIECPLRPPMCVESRLAVTREHGIVLLIAAKQGLGDLRSISQAYRWLSENRELICMALPQFAIDSRQTPRLRLLVDRADLTADVLHPMLQSEHVTIQTYRKLRWGERLGVFLEAA